MGNDLSSYCDCRKNNPEEFEKVFICIYFYSHFLQK